MDVPFANIPGMAKASLEANSNSSNLAEQMAADLVFVAEAEKGWGALSEGRSSDLSAVKRRLGDL
jgi:hypothetical protein